MSAEPRFIPSSSQTVGPFFRIGLDYLVECAPSPGAGQDDTVIIRGRVLDGNRAPVPDALLEFWSARAISADNGSQQHEDFPARFRRAATDLDGRFSLAMTRPEPVPLDHETLQAPHMIVLVFARGLLRHLITRLYFDGEPGNGTDAVLNGIPTERRRTLIAQADGSDTFCWDVILQGIDETVFFAW